MTAPTSHADAVEGGAVVAALTALRDNGLVTSRDDLNGAWAALTGRNNAITGPVRALLMCQRPRCGAPGHPFLEPAGVWCPAHVPRLWRDGPENPWAVPRCATCGKPGRYPTARFGGQPTCRAHANPRTRKYLDTSTEDLHGTTSPTA